MNIVGTEWVDDAGHRMKVTSMTPVPGYVARQSSSDVRLNYEVTHCPQTPCGFDHTGLTHEEIPVLWSEIKARHFFGWKRAVEHTFGTFNHEHFQVGELVEYNMDDSGYMDAPEGWHVGTIFEIDKYDAEFPWRVTLHPDHQALTSEQGSAWFGVTRVRKYVYTIEEEPW